MPIKSSNVIAIGVKLIVGATVGSIPFIATGSVLQQNNSRLFWDNTNIGLGIGTNAPSAALHIAQTVKTTGSPNIMNVVGAAHTTLDASVEASDVIFNLNRTVQFNTGSLATQRAIYIQAPTYAFVGASVLSTAATLSISGPPVAGTNATITRSYSLMTEGGNVCFTQNSNANINIDFLGANTAGANRTVTFKGALGGSASATGFIFDTAVARTAGGLVDFENNAVSKFLIAWDGKVTMTQSVNTSGSPNFLVLTAAAHTTLAASTEASDVSINLARTVQFSTGALTTQRAVLINAPTYAFVGASTITTAATFAITGAPIAGTNATITNPLAFWIQAGGARFDGRTLQAQGADVASAGDLTLGLDGNTFEITGTTTINAITTANWINGSLITLLFTSNPTVKHNTAGGAGTAPMLLAGAVDFSATSGDSLTLRLSEIGGTVAWREIGRAVI